MRIKDLLLITLLSGGVVWPACAESSFDELFEQARSLRTTNPTALPALLARLDAAAATATPTQRDRLRILHAHRMAVSGDAPGAIALLAPMIAAETPSAIRYEAGGLLANTYAITRQFEEALRVLEHVMPLHAAVEDRDVRHTGMQAAGIVYNQVGEYRSGMHYAEQVLADDPAPRSRCLASNLVLESKLGLALPVNLQTTQDAIRTCDAAKEPILAGFSRSYAARWMHEQGETASAIALLESYLPEVERTGYPFLIGQFHSALAEYRFAAGDFQGAGNNASRAVGWLSALNSALPLAVAHRTLYEIAQKDGDSVSALAAYRRYADAERAHFNDVKSREMAYQVVRHQALQQTQQIELLNQKNQVLELQKRVTEQRAQNWLVAAVLLVFLLATIGYWAYRTKRLQMRMQRMAEIDALTGISNRHHFSQQAIRTLAQSAKDGRTVALVMFDLDHFKQINDRLGHAAGDWALLRIASTCLQLCGPDDKFGRLGGEEFAILLPGCDADAAARSVEETMARFAAIDGRSGGYELQLTASFGITDSRRSGYDFTRMLSHADRAMYRAKRGGRNRLYVFEVDAAAPSPILVTDASLAGMLAPSPAGDTSEAASRRAVAV